MRSATLNQRHAVVVVEPSGDRVVGALNLYSRLPNAFDAGAGAGGATAGGICL